MRFRGRWELFVLRYDGDVLWRHSHRVHWLDNVSVTSLIYSKDKYGSSFIVWKRWKFLLVRDVTELWRNCRGVHWLDNISVTSLMYSKDKLLEIWDQLTVYLGSSIWWVQSASVPCVVLREFGQIGGQNFWIDVKNSQICSIYLGLMWPILANCGVTGTCMMVDI